MKGKHRTKLHLNFKTKLVLMISLFNISLVLCVSFFNYLWHSQQLTRQTINQTQQIIEQTGVNIGRFRSDNHAAVLRLQKTQPKDRRAYNAPYRNPCRTAVAWGGRQGQRCFLSVH